MMSAFEKQTRNVFFCSFHRVGGGLKSSIYLPAPFNSAYSIHLFFNSMSEISFRHSISSDSRSYVNSEHFKCLLGYLCTVFAACTYIWICVHRLSAPKIVSARRVHIQTKAVGFTVGKIWLHLANLQPWVKLHGELCTLTSLEVNWIQSRLALRIAIPTRKIYYLLTPQYTT